MTNANRSFDKLLEEGFANLNLPRVLTSCPNALGLLQRYIEEIELFNEAYGLIKVNDRYELIVKHIFDSLAPLGIIVRLLEGKPRIASGNWQIADVGSGAGLPGIPLALCLPQAEITLIERMGRRAGFLRDCVAVMGISNARVEEAEMENAVPGCFDLAVFRAFRPLEPAIFKALLRLLKPDGFLAAWKGRLENARDELLAVEKFAPGLEWEIHPIAVPFLKEERHLVIIRSLPI